MTITVEELRRKYPNPVAFPVSFRNEYCVGWALCRETGLSRNNIGAALMAANPNLDLQSACDIWEHIIAENDDGNFDVAWAWLDKGLSA